MHLLRARMRGMPALGSAEPDSDPVVQRLLTESRARQRARLIGRERIAELAGAAAFVAAAVALAVLAPAGRSLDPVVGAALVALYAVAARVEFHTGSGWTVPTQLVFVPMLFLLPASAVPLFVAAGLAASKLPDYLSGEVRPGRAVVAVGDAWYAVGPALVLSAAGPAAPDWADWPVYAAALGAQFGLDIAASALRECLGYGLRLRELASEMSSVYAVDALLSPVGLLAAFAATQGRWGFLALAPLIALFAVFAREREARIENALELSRAYQGTAHLLGDFLADSHEYTGRHSHSVVALCQRVADAIGFDERLRREVELGALLHDVGKIAIPNEILNKPGKLTGAEWAVIKTHTVEGQRMLERVGGTLAEAGRVVRSHHERWDGGGYPDGLAGEAIPIAARVICVCDAYHAMTSNRPYRDAMPREAAIEELCANAGTQFDPAVVQALVGMVRGRAGGPGGAGPTGSAGPKLEDPCSTSSRRGSRPRSRASAPAAS